VAIELLHNAFLVHDDIADGSERRRSRPTLPAEYGLGLALNAGDALAVLSNQLLRRAYMLDRRVTDDGVAPSSSSRRVGHVSRAPHRR
jgi:geranylgeranyl diphosphate synthase type II